MEVIEQDEESKKYEDNKQWASSKVSSKVSFALIDFLERSRGKKVISKILVANNGMAAVKAIRSIRKWSYEAFGDEGAIKFFSMCTPEDIAVKAESVLLADYCIEVPGGPSNNNYSNVDLIVDIAERENVDAVWVGWGYASENPVLSERLRAKDPPITFIGPSPEAMRALGDKIASTIVAQTAGVPCVPWSGRNVTGVEYDKNGFAYVPREVYEKSVIKSLDEALKYADDIGYPIMIKASEGGGGRGIRIVESKEEFRDNYNQVIREVPGSPIFLMKVVNDCRHLEIQILADTHGNAITLFGRDCSVQRRHQKVIEEAPITVAPSSVIKLMESHALTLGKLVGYQSAGTVEYLYDPKTSEYYFLELNPRLQVEHPTTEMVSGVNIPAAQLQIAMGIPLSFIRDIRIFYGMTPHGTSPIDFQFSSAQSLEGQRRPSPKGHVISARINAENPEAGFRPNSGMVLELNFRSNTNVWGYFSINSRGGVHEYADSQFGHVFSYGESREIARRELVMALKDLLIRGEFRTTVDYIVQLLETETFTDNKVVTSWLDALISKQSQQDSNNIQPPPSPLSAPPESKETNNMSLVNNALAGTAALAYADFTKAESDFTAFLAKGQIPQISLLNNVKIYEFIYQNQLFCINAIHASSDKIRLDLNGFFMNANIRMLSDGGYMIILGGMKYLVYCMKTESTVCHLIVNGKPCDFEKEFDPSILRASSSGKLIRFFYKDGDKIKKNSVYAEVETMKIITNLKCHEDGIIKHVALEGSILKAGDVTAVLTLVDPKKARKVKKFNDPITDFEGSALPLSMKPHNLYAYNYKTIMDIIDGYNVEMPAKRAFKYFLKSLQDPLVVIYEFRKIISNISGRIPPKLEGDLRIIVENTRGDIDIADFVCKCKLILSKVAGERDSNDYKMNLSQADGLALDATLEPLRDLLKDYENGLTDHANREISNILNIYYEVEKIFNSKSYDNAVKFLRGIYKSSLETVVKIVRSHICTSSRVELVLEMISYLRLQEDRKSISSVMHVVSHIANLISSVANMHVVIRARELLSYYNLPQFSERLCQTKEILKAAIVLESQATASLPECFKNRKDVAIMSCSSNRIQSLIFSTELLTATLVKFLFGVDIVLSAVACYTYTLRIYRTYTILDMEITLCNILCGSKRTLVSKWSYTANKFSSGLSPNLLIYESNGDLYCKSMDDPSCVDIGNSKSYCLMFTFESINDVRKSMADISKHFSFIQSDENMRESSSRLDNCIYLVIEDIDSETNENSIQATLYNTLLPIIDVLKSNQIDIVTFVVGSKDVPAYYSFRRLLDYQEDTLLRHIKPSLSYTIEPHRMSNYHVKPHFLKNSLVYVYHATAKNNPSDTRLFARKFVTPSTDLSKDQGPKEALELEITLALTDLIDSLEMIVTSYPNTDCNHIFANFGCSFSLNEQEAESCLRRCIEGFAFRLLKLRVTEVEIKISLDESTETDYSLPKMRHSSYRSSEHPRHKYPSHKLPEAFLELSSFSDRIIGRNIREEPEPIKVLNMCVRYVFSCFTGYVTKIEKYHEYTGSHLESDNSDSGLAFTPYFTKESIQQKRNKAHLLGTTYIYDFPELFKRALEQIWDNFCSLVCVMRPPILLKCTELILNDSKTQLIETSRGIGQNSCGMVAWELELFTPEAPEGRHIIVIANDITTNIGSFGPEEDEVYYLASKLARKKGIPRIYISANSGARIGLEETLLPYIKIAWKEPKNPMKGFDYLYFTEEDYIALSKVPVPELATHFLHTRKKNSAIANCERIVNPDGSVIYKLLDIIGRSYGLGVENLKGSAKIASETSLAYEEIFTLTLVTCRSVGIGAYLARLGQRIIQVEYAPIILTGASALNKILGRNVYSSNLQIGGTQIMHTNGVSHLIAKNDMEGVYMILKWLSFVPASSKSPLPILRSSDPVDRLVETQISPDGSHDPRLILKGYMEDGSPCQEPFPSPTLDMNVESLSDPYPCAFNRLGPKSFKFHSEKPSENGRFIHGFFDRGSFVEYLSGWARGVITARARIGGIPVGVIAVETHPTESVIWADPADELSTEQVISEAAQVWYPDSAKKTAQSIKDFNKGERLPLFIFASWRGFSAGQNDMRREVLKYGANIVDELRCYNQPVFIYIIGELRGGAWVVVDSSINPDMMEMYAEPDSRGGVLAPEGIVEIKFRRPKIMSMMEKFSSEYSNLKNRLGDESISPEIRKNLKEELEKLEEQLMPTFHSVALEFADLHDKAGRMIDKNVVRGVVNWKSSRSFFMWRLLRRIIEDRLIGSICKIGSGISRAEAKDMLARWHSSDTSKSKDYSHDISGNTSTSDNEQNSPEESSNNDEKFLQWLTLGADSIQVRINEIKMNELQKTIQNIHNEFPGVLIKTLKSLCLKDPNLKGQILNQLSIAG